MLSVAAGVLLAAVGSASAAGWLPPASTQPSVRNAEAQDVALDAAGNAVAVWTVQGRKPFTQAATRPVGGSWSPPVTLSPAGEDNGWDPAVAVGANGDAVAVWSSVRRPSGSSHWTRQIVFSSSRDAGGRWSEPLALSDEDGIAITYEPEVVVDAQGNATAIWSEETGEASVVRTRTRPNGGNWSEPVDLTDSLVGSDPKLAVDPQGTVTAVWNWNVPEAGSGIIQSNSRPAAGAWGAYPVDVSGDESAVDPQVAVDSHGDAVAVWHRYIGNNSAVRAAWRTAGSGWATAVDLSHGVGRSLGGHVAIDPQGTATAVWESVDTTGVIVRSSTSPAGEPWSDPVDVSVRDEGPWPGALPQVAVDPQGNVTAVWTAWYADRFAIVQAARREAGTGWSAPVDLGRNNGVIEPRPIAVDPQGYVTSVWTLGNSLHSSVFDAVAPLLRAVAVPTRGMAGQPVAMSVDPFDVWSPVATRWTFGDGSSSTGGAVSHCFSTPGRRTVTVTGTDGATNATSATRTITIEPAVAPAVPPGSEPCAEPRPGPRPGPDPDPRTDPAPRTGPDPRPGPDPDPRPRTRPRPGPTAPVVSGLQQSSSRWRTRVDRRPRLPLGTTFRFKLDRAARVQLAFSQIVSGRRVNARCVTLTRVNRTRPRCRRDQARGTLSVAGRAGSNALAFRGKINGRTLQPGSYRMRLTALANGRRSVVKTIGFTIAR